MKPWRIIFVLFISSLAICLMAGVVAAAPVAGGVVNPARSSDDVLALTDTLPLTHPAASLIALYFNIPYTHVLELHESGFGFGTIARAYLTALQSNGVLTPEQILAMRRAGTGWGQIKKDYGIYPGGNGLGTIMRDHGTPQPVPQPPAGPPDDKQQNKEKGKVDKGGNSGSAPCPGNSCNAPGKTKPGQDPKK
jgi:hypothetical protein